MLLLNVVFKTSLSWSYNEIQTWMKRLNQDDGFVTNVTFTNLVEPIATIKSKNASRPAASPGEFSWTCKKGKISLKETIMHLADVPEQHQES